jgi:hypothetical protein
MIILIVSQNAEHNTVHIYWGISVQNALKKSVKICTRCYAASVTCSSFGQLLCHLKKNLP